MHTSATRKISVFLVVTLILSLLSVNVFAAGGITSGTGYTKASDVQYHKEGSYVANWGARGENAVFQTTYATAYYTGSYTYEALSANKGGTSQSNAASSDLYAALKAMMNAKSTHQTSYNETRDLYKYTDCLKNDTAHISCFYTGKTLNGEWDGGATWNREHTWPNSKGLNGSDENDIMMLRPTDKSANSGRGNKAYGESSSFFDPNGDLSSGSVRGDCARIMLYVYVRWGNTGNMWGSSGVMENLNVLLKWMEEDPVDTWEMGRNDAVQSITGVRNVFVDYPELAFQLFGQKVPEGMSTPSNGTITPVDPDPVDPTTPTTPTTPVDPNATSATVDLTAQGYANNTLVSSVSSGFLKVTFGSGSNRVSPTYYENGDAVRCYANNTITVESTKGNIKTLVIETVPTGQANTLTLTPDVGSLRMDGTTATWTGDAAKVVFTVTGGTSGQVRIQTLTATLTAAKPDDKPDDKPTDEQKIVDAAYALEKDAVLEGGPHTLTGKVTEITYAFNAESDAKDMSLKLVVSGREDKPILCYRLIGAEADKTLKEKLADVKVGDTITVEGTLKNYNGTIEFDRNCKLMARNAATDKPDDKPTPSTPATEAEKYEPNPEHIAIVEKAYALEPGKALEGTQTLTGKIIKIDTKYDANYKNVTVTIEIPGIESKPIQCFRLIGSEKLGSGFSASALKVGDIITVSGTLKNYEHSDKSTTIEFDAGCKLVKVFGKSASTGDNNILAPVTVVMMLSVVGLVAVVENKKRFVR